MVILWEKHIVQTGKKRQDEAQKKNEPKTRFCVPREARTLDPLIKSQLLYQLS